MAEHTALLVLAEHMTVGDLARHLGMSVEELVALVLEPGRSPAPKRARLRGTAPTAEPVRPRRPKASSKAASSRQGETSVTERGRRIRSGASRSSRRKNTREPTRKELLEAVDRWLLGEVLDETGGNISRTAERLGAARARVRRRWAAVRRLPADELDARLARVRSSSAPPSKDELRAGTFRAVHEAIDRWLLTTVLEQEDGNVTKAAERLGTSRKVIRELRERLGFG